MRTITTSVCLRHDLRCVPTDGTRDCVSAARKFVTSTSVAADHCRRNAVSVLSVLESGNSLMDVVSRRYFNCLTVGMNVAVLRGFVSIVSALCFNLVICTA